MALRGGAADHRGAEHRQARAVPRRVPRARHSGAAAGHQREPAALHRRARQGRALRPDRDQERRRGRDRVAARGAGEAGPHHVAARRSARISICGWSTSACSRAWSRPARSIRSCAGRPAYEALPTAALRPRLLAAVDAACEHGARVQRDGNEGQAQLFGAFDVGDGARGDGGSSARRRCPRRRRGPRPSSSASRRRRSASTGAAIRSIATRRS